MELGERKLKILNAIVESYVTTGEPIASKSLCEIFDFSVSSATIRNEMAELVKLGLLEQPHTSAGRIPSHLGYRIYVDYLMKKSDISNDEKEVIDKFLLRSCDDIDNLFKASSYILAKLLNSISFSTSLLCEKSYIDKIEVIKINNHVGMVILLISSGIIKNKTFVCDYTLTTDILKIFRNILNQKLTGILISEMTPAFIQTIAVSMGEMSMLLSSILASIKEAAEEALNVKINVFGQENLLLLTEFELSNIREILKFLNDKNSMKNLLCKKINNTVVTIGNENKEFALKNSTVIMSQYHLKNSCSDFGTIGILSPVRIDYSKMISTVDYVTASIGELTEKIINLKK